MNQQPPSPNDYRRHPKHPNTYLAPPAYQITVVSDGGGSHLIFFAIEDREDIMQGDLSKALFVASFCPAGIMALGTMANESAFALMQHGDKWNYNGLAPNFLNDPIAHFRAWNEPVPPHIMEALGLTKQPSEDPARVDDEGVAEGPKGFDTSWWQQHWSR